jgi:hypothetical protein
MPSHRNVATIVRPRIAADANLDIWMGLPHGFVVGIGRLEAFARP